MKEIVSVKLENEMDLILAHKRAMKICELTGLTLITQTSFATAVSEIARCAIEFGSSSVLSFSIESAGGKSNLCATIKDARDFTPRCVEACNYAKRLVGEVLIQRSPKAIAIILKHKLAFAGTLSAPKVETFADYFKREPPLSPYDELRRKNILLQELSDKVKESENEYRVLTDSLPLMMFAVNSRATVTYANKWLTDFLGTVPKDLSSTSWQQYIHEQDYAYFYKELNTAVVHKTAFSGQFRFRERSSDNFVWHLMSIIPLKNEREAVTQWIGFIVDVHAQKLFEQTLKDNRFLKEMQERLEENQEELKQKVMDLNRSNYELEQFAHLASHDLQEPLRKLFFYADILKKRYAPALDDSASTLLNNMTAAAGRMKELISDLLSYSQLQQQTLAFDKVDLQKVITEVMRDLEVAVREKNAQVEIGLLPPVNGNELRLRQLFVNLVSNALKYSKKEVTPVIAITSEMYGDDVIVKVKDNGIGFDTQYSEKIFGLFERLHTRSEIPGTGIGLSICKRIAELHQGKISASSVPGEYSVFEVTFPAFNE